MSHAPLEVCFLVCLNKSVNGSCAPSFLREFQEFFITVDALEWHQVTDGIDIPQILVNRLVRCWKMREIFSLKTWVWHTFEAAYSNIPSHTPREFGTSKLFQQLKEFSTFCCCRCCLQNNSDRNFPTRANLYINFTDSFCVSHKTASKHHMFRSVSRQKKRSTTVAKRRFTLYWSSLCERENKSYGLFLADIERFGRGH